MCYNSHNEILCTPRQCYCRDVCNSLLWLAEFFMSKILTTFHRSNSIDITCVRLRLIIVLRWQLSHCLHYRVTIHRSTLLINADPVVTFKSPHQENDRFVFIIWWCECIYHYTRHHDPNIATQSRFPIYIFHCELWMPWIWTAFMYWDGNGWLGLYEKGGVAWNYFSQNICYLLSILLTKQVEK